MVESVKIKDVMLKIFESRRGMHLTLDTLGGHLRGGVGVCRVKGTFGIYRDITHQELNKYVEGLVAEGIVDNGRRGYILHEEPKKLRLR